MKTSYAVDSAHASMADEPQFCKAGQGSWAQAEWRFSLARHSNARAPTPAPIPCECWQNRMRSAAAKQGHKVSHISILCMAAPCALLRYRSHLLRAAAAAAGQQHAPVYVWRWHRCRRRTSGPLRCSRRGLPAGCAACAAVAAVGCQPQLCHRSRQPSLEPFAVPIGRHRRHCCGRRSRHWHGHRHRRRRGTAVMGPAGRRLCPGGVEGSGVCCPSCEWLRLGWESKGVVWGGQRHQAGRGAALLARGRPRWGAAAAHRRTGCCAGRCADPGAAAPSGRRLGARWEAGSRRLHQALPHVAAAAAASGRQAGRIPRLAGAAAPAHPL